MKTTLRILPGLAGLTPAALLLAAAAAGFEPQVYRVQRESLVGHVLYEAGQWRVGSQRFGTPELLFIRFTDELPPARLASGVFVRGGCLLTGQLETLLGEEATLRAAALGRRVTLKREDLAGAFYALPLGEPENLPALGRYADLHAALRRAGPSVDEGAAGAPGVPARGFASGGRDARYSAIAPGWRNRVTYYNLDGLDGRLVRLGAEKAFVEQADAGVATPDRQLIRLVELRLPPASTAKEPPAGPAVVVRLKSGDVLRGGLEKLSAQALSLATSFAGAVEIPRAVIAMLRPAEGPGRVWLSGLKPVKSEQTSLFDARFPARNDLSSDENLICLGGVVCDRGLGVHARSELTYALEAIPGRRFVALVGIDDETGGRGDAEASVLVDGQEAWKSGPLAPRAAPRLVSVPLGTARRLLLRVDFGPDGDDSGDHVGWGWAAIVGP